MQKNKTLIIGASDNPERYSYLALNRLLYAGHRVLAIGKKTTTVNGVTISTEITHYEDVDTVTLYINPALQNEYFQYILSLKPRRIICNPGTENEKLQQLAKANGIEVLEACTLVMLSAGTY